ncbi:MAG: hypothetical protein ACFFEK_03960 [Candidatus Thorarchaeota archaeon]
MKVEIDVSEVEYGLYYRDENCKELEKILQNDLKYAECEVKRVQWGDADTNPFDVLDENGDSIVLLETWEVNTLSPSELLSYIEVKQKIDRPLSDADAMLYGAFGALGMAVVALLVLMIFYGPIMELEFLAISVFILTPILGILSIRTYRKSIHERKSADLEATKKDSLFIEILRKLAQAPEINESNRRKIMKRIETLGERSNGH